MYLFSRLNVFPGKKEAADGGTFNSGFHEGRVAEQERRTSGVEKKNAKGKESN